MSTTPTTQVASVPATAQAAPAAPVAAQAAVPAAAAAEAPPLRIARESIEDPVSGGTQDTLAWLEAQMSRPGLNQTQLATLQQVHQQLLQALQAAFTPWGVATSLA